MSGRALVIPNPIDPALGCCARGGGQGAPKRMILQHVSEVLVLVLGLILHTCFVTRFLVGRAVDAVAATILQEHVDCSTCC